MNALERRFACIHNLRERDELMLQALEVSQNRKVVEGIKRRHRRRARKLKNGPYKNRGKKRKALAEQPPEADTAAATTTRFSDLGESDSEPAEAGNSDAEKTGQESEDENEEARRQLPVRFVFSPGREESEDSETRTESPMQE